MSEQPSMRSYGRHILICNHGDCAESDTAELLFRQVEQWNRDSGLNRLHNPHRVKCSLVDCLGICQKGPILAVYPDGIWYHGVDNEKLARIYREHLIGGAPVEELIFHRLYSSGQEPIYAPDARGDAPYAVDTDSLVLAGLHGNSDDALSSSAHAEEADQRRQEARRKTQKKGLVIVNTGDGKGKTTAALGVMMRAWGRKMKVGIVQFLKHENARYGEIKAAARMGEIAATLIRRGTPVLALNPHRLDDIWRSILLVGGAVGRQREAHQLVATLQSQLETLRADVAIRPRVYFEEWCDPLISGIGWVDDLIHLVGGQSIFPELADRGLAAQRIVSPEAVIAARPNVIIASWCGKKADLNAICTRPGWETLPAVQNGRVYEIHSDQILQTGPVIVEGARALKLMLDAAQKDGIDG